MKNKGKMLSLKESKKVKMNQDIIDILRLILLTFLGILVIFAIIIIKVNASENTIYENAKVLIKQGEGLNLLGNEPIAKKYNYRGYSSKTCYVKHGGKIISTQDGLECLNNDISKINTSLHHYLPNMTDNEYSALIDLVYMIGMHKFLNSELYAHIKQYQSIKSQPIYKRVFEKRSLEEMKILIEFDWVEFGWIKIDGKNSEYQKNRMKRQFDLFFS